MRGPHHPHCTRAHQAGALLLVALTFLLTRLLSTPPPPFPISRSRSAMAGPWPDLAPNHDHLRVYVYEEDEIDGLRALLRGRDNAVSATTCLKGQWGTQVKIHQLLLKSRFRTLDKDEAHLFFVPSYVKCVRMTGGLTDKEINQTYVKVLSQMPYFRRSGGRDHIFVFPSGAGAHLFRSWATFLNRSIILTPEDCLLFHAYIASDFLRARRRRPRTPDSELGGGHQYLDDSTPYPAEEEHETDVDGFYTYIDE